MVNKAIEGMVIEKCGKMTWQKILMAAGMEDEIFISNQAYPDELTYNLVASASKTMGEPVEKVLEDFGNYWVMGVARIEYADLMTRHGLGFGEFLDHLPNFHSRLEMIFPNFKPPTFRVRERASHSLKLQYATHREGLSQFVVGILYGLGEFYHTKVTISRTCRREDNGEYDEYLVEWEPPNCGYDDR